MSIVFFIFSLGGGRQRGSKSKDNIPAQEDQVHFKESPAKSDQQAAERAQEKQLVWHVLYISAVFIHPQCF